ncbi:hypothetical protein L6270_01405 [Candidatus Parcubacteria bacterium]|nr:hypothetical protein [Patescibacteria group bacterium]MBU4309797.1 hypothetical protein [Patescibacteria group bacterium]MBU4431803.1 hypothetical protein [Patescibacteria group bacterium]MBU4578136.1 hypothetical protein [Patescibacteria group bacterium]MCG2696673.1 hypothetical protein [Candidatus Parcubacteria bacterium]
MYIFDNTEIKKKNKIINKSIFALLAIVFLLGTVYIFKKYTQMAKSVDNFENITCDNGKKLYKYSYMLEFFREKFLEESGSPRKNSYNMAKEMQKLEEQKISKECSDFDNISYGAILLKTVNNIDIIYLHKPWEKNWRVEYEYKKNWGNIIVNEFLLLLIIVFFYILVNKFALNRNHEIKKS